MAKKKSAKRPMDREYKESLIGQYEGITGRDWYDVELLMKAGDISATLIFVTDHILNKIEATKEQLGATISEHLENIWGQVADMNKSLKTR